jgi:hypothetical protein
VYFSLAFCQVAVQGSHSWVKRKQILSETGSLLMRVAWILKRKICATILFLKNKLKFKYYQYIVKLVRPYHGQKETEWAGLTFRG